MNKLIILICKLSQKILNKIGRGSSFPGQLAIKLNPNILKYFKLPNKVVAVTGSSGKGSITSMVANIARTSGLKVAHNAKGSNLLPGIVSMLIENSDLNGNIQTDIIVAEVDERYTKLVFPYLNPSHVVINNLTRDQSPRQGNYDFVFKEIDKALTKDMHLIINADDPMLQRFLYRKNKVTYFSVNENKYSYKTSKFENLNLSYCPKCGSKIKYNYYNFEEIGDYYCPKCSFKKEKAKNICTNVDYENNIITVNNKTKLHIKDNIIYYIYNTMAAYTMAKEIGFNEKNIIDGINNMYENNKNLKRTIDNRNLTILYNKNENRSTYNQSLLFLDRTKDLKTIIIGYKRVSYRYNFNDLSWLYDIDFEILKKHKIDKIVCVGLNKYDLATRLKYAGIDEDKLITFDDIKEATIYTKEKTKGNIYAVLNPDYIESFKKVIMDGDNND